MEEKYFLDKQSVRGLCGAIVLSAIKDWKSLCKKEAKKIKDNFWDDPDVVTVGGETFASITRFFRSDYGESCCLVCDIHPDRVMKFLENTETIPPRTRERRRINEV